MKFWPPIGGETVGGRKRGGESIHKDLVKKLEGIMWERWKRNNLVFLRACARDKVLQIRLLFQSIKLS